MLHMIRHGLQLRSWRQLVALHSNVAHAAASRYSTAVPVAAQPLTHASPPPVDTLELVKRLQSSGVNAQQAEELAKHICEVISGALERLEAKFASKAEVEKAAFLQDAAFGLFKAEIKTTLEVRQAAMTRDFDAVRAECEKLRTELKYEIDKIQASQRLDLNLEKGRIRDELLSQNQKAAQTENRLDKEMTNMKTTLEANKNDIVRFAVGAIASTTAIGLGILRLLI